jgi:glycyl-tRNA synthetase beta chain
MVSEFPELQGIMGGYYARAQGESDAVADAVRDHYKPVGQGDDVPTAPVTVAVSLADKLDTLVGFFAINERPSGSRDPFALRRATIGCIETFIASDVRCSVRDIVREAYRLLAVQMASSHPLVSRDLLNSDHFSALLAENSSYAEDLDLAVLYAEPLWVDFNEMGQPVWNSEYLSENGQIRFNVSSLTDTVGSVTEYFFDRVRERQKRQGRRADIVSAVLPNSFLDIGHILDLDLGKVRVPNWTVDDDVIRQLNAGQALEDFVTTAEGANLLAAYKRAANILKQAESSSPSTRDGEGDRSAQPRGGGAPPSVADATATSPSLVDGEDILVT